MLSRTLCSETKLIAKYVSDTCQNHLDRTVYVYQLSNFSKFLFIFEVGGFRPLVSCHIQMLHSNHKHKAPLNMNTNLLVLFHNLLSVLTSKIAFMYSTTIILLPPRNPNTYIYYVLYIQKTK